jgi:hypothetical protein
MNLLAMTTPIQRALTGDELTHILDRVDAAEDTGQLLATVVRAVYDTLLADVGLRLDALPAGQQLDPRQFLIPARQWEAITDAVTARAAAWGTGAQLALDLINVMPSTYEDPDALVPDRPHPDYRPELLELHVTRDAVDVIAAATAHVHAIGDFYGLRSDRYVQAAGSWLAALARLLSMSLGADTRIRRDGNLSLLVHTGSGLTYGLIFHGATRICVAGDNCSAVIADDGTAHTLTPTAALADHVHRPSFALDAPRPGSWSFHS